MKREAFNFYRSYYDVLEEIRKPDDKLTYLMALLDRQFRGIEPELVNIPRLVYNSQKHSIDKQVKGWEDKMKVTLYDPYEPPTEGGYEGPTEHPNQHPTEPPSPERPMTTEGGYEGPTEHPSLQEKEKEQEKEEEQVYRTSGEKIVEVDLYDNPSTIKQYLDDGYTVMTGDRIWTYEDIEILNIII